MNTKPTRLKGHVMPERKTRQGSDAGSEARFDLHRLWPNHARHLEAHFLRLDPESRRLRFGNSVNDEFLRNYAATLTRMDSIIFGAWIDGQLRGVGEIRGLPVHWNQTAEAALSVEREWQDRGIGNAILKRLVAAAQNRGVKELHMICLRENRKMQHLASKHDALTEYDQDSAGAQIHPAWPTPVSLIEEMGSEARNFLRSVLYPGEIRFPWSGRSRD